jgi:FAD binding domain-containing protein
MRKEAGAGLAFQECSWFSTYRIHHRRAARFRDRRCFLLGDAAHIHSPVGAQGMNTGLQDAYNLAWKLALVVSGRADAALLDTYSDERIPVAQQLLSTTDRAFSLVVSDTRLAGLIRTRVIAKVLAFAMKIERVRRLAFRTISQIGIHYPQSPLSQALPGLPAAAPQAGDRFPWMRLALEPKAPAVDLFQKLDDMRFNLIVIGQDSPPQIEGLDDLLRVFAIPDDPVNERELARVGIPRPSFYLLRPDGHVGLAGTWLDPAAIARYASEWLRLGMK